MCATICSASVFLLARQESTAFLRVFEDPQPSRTAAGHSGSPSILTFVSALVFSLAPDPAITHYLLKYLLHPPCLSLSLPSLSFYLCPSFSHCHLLSLCLCLCVSLSLSLSLLFSVSTSLSCVLSSLSRSAHSLSPTTSRSCSCSCFRSRSRSVYVCLCV